MAYPSEPSSPFRSKYTRTCRILQVLKLLVMKVSPASCHFIPLRSKHSTQHRVLKNLQPSFLPYCQRPSFTPIQKYKYTHSYVLFNLYVFIQRTTRQDVLNWMVTKH
jgi:hypothetical protein